MIFPAGGSTKSGDEDPELEQDEGIGGDQGDVQGHGGHQDQGDGQGQRAKDGWLGERQETAGFCFVFRSTQLVLIILWPLIFLFNQNFHFSKIIYLFSLGQILRNLGVEFLVHLILLG